MALTATTQTELYRFFIIAFDAAPGVTYMNQLADAVNAGMSTRQVVEVFTTKPQFLSVYPQYLTNEQFAARLIENVVGASATQSAKNEAIADVTAALNTAGWTRGQVIYQLFNNIAGKTGDAIWGGTAQLLANQVAVAKYYTEVMGGSTDNLVILSKVISLVTHTTDVTADIAKLTLIQKALNTAPTFAQSTLSFDVAENSTAVFTASAADAENATQTVVYSLSGADAAKFVINETTGVVAFAAAPNFEAPGSANGTNTYQFNVVARDKVGSELLSSSSQAVTVTVSNANEAPTFASASVSFSTQEDTALAGSVVATDVDGNALSYVLVTAPSNGAVSVNANGQFVYTPNANYSGADSFVVRATDGLLSSGNQTVNVTVAAVNDQPTARPVQAAATEDGVQLSGNLRTDGAAADIDSASLTFSLVSGAPGFTLAANGDWTFNPGAAAFQSLKAGEVTNVEATYRVTDGSLSASNTVTFTVTGANDAPQATAITVSGYENVQVSGQVTATDVDGDTLTYSAANATNGVVEVDAATGNYVFTPATNFNGVAGFDFTATDGKGGSVTRAVTINVIDVVNVLSAGLDTFNLTNPLVAEAVRGTNNTLNAGDVINGGAEDSVVLGIDSSLANNDFAGFRLNGVGTFQVTNDDNAPVSFDMSSSDGVRTLVSQNSTEDVRFNFANTNPDSDSDGHAEVNLQALNLTDGVNVTLDVRNDDAVGLTELNLRVTDSDDDGLDADEISVTAQGTGAVDETTDAGIEVINLDTTGSTGEVRINDLNTPGAQTLNITTAEDLVIGDTTGGLSAIENAVSGSIRAVNVTGAGDVALSTADSTGGVTITGGAGDDTYFTSETFGDRILSGAGNDTVNAGGGANYIEGGEGNDSITSGAGNDTVLGGNGDDTVNAGDGNNQVSGEGGNDTLTVGAGNNVVSGGDGNDTVNATAAGDNNLSGGTGNDTFNVGGQLTSAFTELTDGQTDAANGTQGGDTIDGGDGIDTLNIASPSGDSTPLDRVTNVENINLADYNGSWVINVTDTSAFDTNGSPVTINAADLDAGETLTFGHVDSGSGGTLNNGNPTGDDGVLSRAITVIGGAGNDSITTGSGNDSIDGNAGDDLIASGTGNDTVESGTGVDNVNLGAGDDLLIVQDAELAGNDVVTGGTGNDTIRLDNPAKGSIGAVTIDADLGAGVTGVETLLVNDLENTYNNNTVEVVFEAAYNQTAITVDGSALDGGESLVVDTSAQDADGQNIVSAVDTVVENFNIIGGAGNDVFRMGDNLGSDTIDGNNGTDTIVFNGTVVDADFAGVTEVEVLQMTDGSGDSATLAANAQAAGIRTVIGSNLNDTVNAAAYSAALTVNGGAGNDTVTTGSGDDVINGGAGNDVIDAGLGNDTVTIDSAGTENVTLGGGNDTLVVTGAFLDAADTISGGAGTDTIGLDNRDNAPVTANVDLTDVTGIERFVTVDSNREPTDTPYNFRINFSGGDVGTLTPIEVDARSLTDDDGDSLTVDLSALADKDYAFTIWGGNNADTVIGSLLPENLRFDAGAGNDTLQIDGTDLGTTVTTDGGAGRDTLAISTGSVTDDSFVGVTSYEILTATTGLGLVQAQLGAEALRAGIDSVIGGAGNDNIQIDPAFTRSLDFDLRAGGDDTFNGGAASQAFLFRASESSLDANDFITGGASGNDVIEITADDTPGAVLTNVNGVETVRVVEGGDNNIGITIANTTFTGVAAGTRLVIDATALDDVDVNGAGGAGIEGGLNLSAAVTNGRGLSVLGGTGDDTIVTGDGADIIDLGEGNDFADSGAGDDVVTNLGGNNTVVAGDGNDSVTLADGNNSVTGGNGNDTVSVGNGANFIDGGAGADSITVVAGVAAANTATTNTILGGAGNDTINVVASRSGDTNRITGGDGADQITLGTGNDIVRYTQLVESSAAVRDTVVDFNQAGDDTVWVEDNVLGAGVTGLAFAGNAADSLEANLLNTAVDGIAQAVYVAASGSLPGRLLIDIDDDGDFDAGDIAINMANVAGGQLAASDLRLVDTIAPAAPTLVDLLPGSDSGSPTDNLTNLSPVTVRVSLNTTAIDGTAARVGDTVTLTGGAAPVSVPLTLADILAGSVDLTVALNANSINNLSVRITDQATALMGSNNVSAAATLAVTHDNTAPVVAINDFDGVSDAYLNDAEDDSVTITGTATGAEGRTLTVTVTDGTLSVSGTAVVSSGTWTVSGLNLSSLAQGTLTATASVSDAAGNVGTSPAVTTTHDSLHPTVTVNAFDGGDGFLNDAEDNAVTISGTSTGAVGRTVTISVSDGVNTAVTGTATIAGDGSWSVAGLNLSGLNQGTLTVSAAVTDLAGNANTSTLGTTTTTHDSVHPTPLTIATVATDDVINGVEAAGVTVFGTTEVGSTVTLDGNPALVDAGGAWTYALSAGQIAAFGEGGQTLTAVSTDAAGNTTTTTRAIQVDTIAPVVAINDFDGVSDAYLNDAEDDSVTITGTATGAEGRTLTVTVTDGTLSVSGTAVVSSGTWTVSGLNLSSLAQGTLTATASVSDAAGNVGTSPAVTTTHDSLHPTVTVNAFDGGDGFLNDAEDNAVTISGTSTDAVGRTVTISVSDGVNTAVTGTATIAGDGSWSVAGLDLSGLNQGTLTVSAAVTDVAGNANTSTLGTTTTTHDSVAPAITSGATATAITENSGAGQLVYTATATDTNTPVTFSEVTDAAAAFTINSATGAVTLTPNPDYETATSYSYTLRATDAAGNTTDQTFTLAINDLNDNAPVVTLASTSDTGFVLSVADADSTAVNALRLVDGVVGTGSVVQTGVNEDATTAFSVVQIPTATTTIIEVTDGANLSGPAFQLAQGTSVNDTMGAPATGSGLYYGFGGNDNITGGTAIDTIYAGSGNDTIYAGSGNDTIYGGDGADVITGGSDADRLFGEAGADTYVIGTEGQSGVSSLWTDVDASQGVNNGDTFSFAGVGGTDVIAWGSGDLLDLNFSTFRGPLTSGSGVGDGSWNYTGANSGDVWFIRGGFNVATQVFTVDTVAGADTLVLWTDTGEAALGGEQSVVLTGVTALTIADLI